MEQAGSEIQWRKVTGRIWPVAGAKNHVVILELTNKVVEASTVQARKLTTK